MEISQALLLGRIDPFDRSLLLAKAIAKDRTFVLAHPQYRLTKEEIAQYTEFITRRANHEPIAYILGEKEFFGLSKFPRHNSKYGRWVGRKGKG